MADNINNDLTDLTENGTDTGKEKGKKKKEKKPPPDIRAEAPEDDDKAGKKEGKRGKKDKAGKKKGIKLKLILIIIPIILVAAVVAALILNFFGARDILNGLVSEPILKTIVWLDPQFTSVNKVLVNRSEEREKELSKREAGLDERETKIEAREETLDEREIVINARETAVVSSEAQIKKRSDELDKREAVLNDQELEQIPIYLREMTEQERADKVSLSRSYGNMAPETAADILSKLSDLQNVAAILYFMSERNAAAILSEMEPVFAARITEILLKT